MYRRVKTAMLTGLVCSVVALSTGSAEAGSVSCTLKDVVFSDLTTRQSATLEQVGATCKGDGTTPDDLRFGQKGYILVNGKRLSFLDFSVEDAESLYGQPATVFAYIDVAFLDETVTSWLFDYRGVMSEGEAKYGRVFPTEPKLELVVSGRTLHMVDRVSRAETMRKGREMYRALVISKSRKALVELKGKIQSYSNAPKLYLSTRSIKIVDKMPEG